MTLSKELRMRQRADVMDGHHPWLAGCHAIIQFHAVDHVRPGRPTFELRPANGTPKGGNDSARKRYLNAGIHRVRNQALSLMLRNVSRDRTNLDLRNCLTEGAQQFVSITAESVPTAGQRIAVKGDLKWHKLSLARNPRLPGPPQPLVVPPSPDSTARPSGRRPGTTGR